jgi:hypothetical protein
MDLPKKWNEHIRRASQTAKLEIHCPLCGYGIQNSQDAHQAARANFEQHLADSHSGEKTTDTERTTWIESQWVAAQRCVAAYFCFSFHFIPFVLVFLSCLSLLCFDGVTRYQRRWEPWRSATQPKEGGRHKRSGSKPGRPQEHKPRIEPQKGGVRIQGRFTTKAWVGRQPGRV